MRAEVLTVLPFGAPSPAVWSSADFRSDKKTKFRQYFVYYRNYLRSMGGKKPLKTGLIPPYTALAFYFSVAMVISACLSRKICVACVTFSSSSCLFILSMASS